MKNLFIMMEEVGDDTNGESTFEFVEDKNDENLLQPGLTESLPIPTLEQLTVSSNVDLNKKEGISTPLVTTFGNLPPPQPTPFFPTIPQGIENTTTSSLYFPSRPISSVLPESVYSPSPSSPIINSPPATVTQPVSTISIPTATVDLPIDEYPSIKSPSQEGNGMWGWIKNNELLNKVAEKAKNSVDSMITTLDPGMKEIIYSGGNISIIVASDKEIKVSPIREAFQYVFGRATVEGLAAQSYNIAAQPVGFAVALKAAEERIFYLRQQGLIHEHQPAIAVENFLAELTPDKWYDIGCLVLQDPRANLTLHTYTQATPVPSEYISQVQDQTPPDYPLRWSGLAMTVGQVMSTVLGISHTEWHQRLVGVSRREMLLLAAKSLAGMYKNYLNR